MSSDINGNDLVKLIGHSTNDKLVLDTLNFYKITKPKADDSHLFYKSVCRFSPKRSLRFDLFEKEHYKDITASNSLSEGEWIIGYISFLAAGADDRIKQTYAGSLPHNLHMLSTADECIRAIGKPDLDETIEMYHSSIADYSERVLAWRQGKLNTVITFTGASAQAPIQDFSICSVGCIETWIEIWPTVFSA